jgi:zona occludens toxin
MITIITGTPGSGKTLYLIDTLSKIKDRTIYYHNINNLQLDWVELDDPENFHVSTEPGAIYVLDEAQQTFPVRDFKKQKPDAVAFLETHRHHGIDIYFITQHASMLDVHIRRLAGTHIHLNRNFGQNFVTKYTANSVIDPKNYHELKTAEKTTWRFPKKTFDLYKSSEVHTHKKRIPVMLLLIPIGLIAIYFLMTSLIDTLGIWQDDTPELIDTNTPLDVTNPIQTHQPGKTYTLKDFQPEYPSIPESAPVYASLWQPVTFPKLNCISSKTRCHCYTQQGTYYKVSEDICRNRIQYGYFDITKEMKENNKNDNSDVNTNANNEKKQKFRSASIEKERPSSIKL